MGAGSQKHDKVERKNRRGQRARQAYVFTDSLVGLSCIELTTFLGVIPFRVSGFGNKSMEAGRITLSKQLVKALLLVKGAILREKHTLARMAAYILIVLLLVLQISNFLLLECKAIPTGIQ